jgi:hypothetical protein
MSYDQENPTYIENEVNRLVSEVNGLKREFAVRNETLFTPSFIFLSLIALLALGYGIYAVYYVAPTPGPPGPIGNPGPPGSAGLHGADGSLDPAITHIVYVMVGGNDTSGTGQLDKPFRTITHALQSITDASTINRYGIVVGPGRYDESVIYLKAWVWIIGQHNTATRTTFTGDILAGPEFNVTGNYRLGLRSILISGSNGINFDLQSLSAGSGSTVFEIQETHVNNKFVFKGRSTADYVESRRNQFLGGIELYALQFLSFSDYIPNGGGSPNILVSDVGLQSGTEGILGQFSGSHLGGTILLRKTLDKIYRLGFGGLNTLEVTSLTANSTIGGSNGNMTISSDLISTPTTIVKTAYVDWTFVSRHGQYFSDLGTAQLNSTGGVHISYPGVTADSGIYSFVRPGHSSVGGMDIISPIAGVGFTIQSKSGVLDANVQVMYFVMNKIITPNS